jgi:hypothetical protein
MSEIHVVRGDLTKGKHTINRRIKGSHDHVRGSLLDGLVLHWDAGHYGVDGSSVYFPVVKFGENLLMSESS